MSKRGRFYFGKMTKGKGALGSKLSSAPKCVMEKDGLSWVKDFQKEEEKENVEKK